MKRQLALALTALLLASCGGGSGSNTTPATPKTQPQSASGSVVISIPTSTGQTPSSKVRYPQFVSPNASSVSLSINGGAATIFNVAAGSSLCTTVAGARNCTLTFGAPVGSDTFGFLIFSGPNGTGTQLASATTVQTIAAGTGFNFTVAMNAAIGTMIVNFMLVTNSGNMTCPDQSTTFNGITEGCAGSAPMTVTVEDPSGATITGTAPFAGPISVSGNDPSLSANPSQITAPGQTVTLSYSGAPFTSINNTTQATVTLAAGGQTTQFQVPTEESNLYVAMSNSTYGAPASGSGGDVAVYAFGATGAAVPRRIITGGSTQLYNPEQPLVDSSGNLYVLDNGPFTSNSNPLINVYAPGATGNAAPIRQITGIAAIDGNSACETMAFSSNQQQLYVSCDDPAGGQGAVHVFPASGNGLASTLQVTEMQDDGWYAVETGMAFDNGNLTFYVADSGANAIDEYAVSQVPTSGGNSYQNFGPAQHSINGYSVFGSGTVPLDLLIDDPGSLWASVAYPAATANASFDQYNEIAMWRTSSIPCSSCAPSATLTGAPFTTHSPAGIAFDPSGNLYVSNPFQNDVYVISRTIAQAASGNVANPAYTTLSTAQSGSSSPVGLTVGP